MTKIQIKDMITRLIKEGYSFRHIDYLIWGIKSHGGKSHKIFHDPNLMKT